MTNLINIAVHGTKHRNTQTVAQQLRQLNGGLQLETVEGQLLLHFGVKDIERRAGYVPERITDDVNLPFAPTETQPLCSRTAVMQIYRLMRGSLMGMLDMWIDKFTASGQRIPPEWIPALLQSDEDTIYVLGVLRPLLGERGQWLAQVSEHPAWLEAYQHEFSDWGDEPIGFTKQHDDLLQLRRKNPHAGLMWLRQHWDSIDFRMKYWFVDALEHGLSVDDEQFLWERVQETVTHAYGDDIAGLAARMLTQIPDSEYGRLIIAIAANAFAIVRQKNKIYIDFCWTQHFEYDPQSLSRECLEPIVGKLRSYSLSHIARFIPLDYWWQQWQVTPLELIDAALRGSNAKMFVNGWFWRTVQEKHPTFASALLQRSKQISRFLSWSVDRIELCRIISWQEYETLMTTWLQD